MNGDAICVEACHLHFLFKLSVSPALDVCISEVFVILVYQQPLDLVAMTHPSRVGG